jgi:hypothetical protein
MYMCIYVYVYIYVSICIYVYGLCVYIYVLFGQAHPFWEPPKIRNGTVLWQQAGGQATYMDLCTFVIVFF